MANSGGGSIIVGVDDHGRLSDADCTGLLALDSAKIVDKIAPYVGVQFADFEVRPGQRDAKAVAVIEIQGIFPPMVFAREGAYDIVMHDGKKKTRSAFARGTVYFRHGAKSEPANSHDLKHVIDKHDATERKLLLSNFGKVARMPKGTQVQFVPSGLAKPGNRKAVPVRLVSDPAAPMVRGLDPDRTHPFRQTELLAELNKRLVRKKMVSGHMVQCVRKVYGIDAKDVYSHQPKFGTRQYSRLFVDWMVEQSKKSKKFFTAACKKAKALAKEVD